MAIQGSDESGLIQATQYYFRYNRDGLGFVESSIIPGSGAKEKTRLNYIGLTTAGDYWLLNSVEPDGTELQWYIWYKLNGAGTDPGPIGSRVGFFINYVFSKGQIASSVASLTAAALEYEGGIISHPNGNWQVDVDPKPGFYLDAYTLPPTAHNILEMENKSGGAMTDINADNAPAIGSVTVDTQGEGGTDWNTITSDLNLATDGATWSIYQEDARLTSDTLGGTIALNAGLSGTNLFTNLTGFTAFDASKDSEPSEEHTTEGAIYGDGLYSDKYYGEEQS